MPYRGPAYYLGQSSTVDSAVCEEAGEREHSGPGALETRRLVQNVARRWLTGKTIYVMR